MEGMTVQDCDHILEALDSWEKDVPDGFIGILMVAVLGDKLSPEARAEHEAKQEQEKLERERTIRNRKNTAVRIKAKVLSVRDSLMADVLTAL